MCGAVSRALRCKRYTNEIAYYPANATLVCVLSNITLISLFLVSHSIFLFIPCGRLSWLLVSFLLHVIYIVSNRIVSHIKSEVTLFFLCLGTDISATVRLIGVKFCMMVELRPGRVFSPFGGDNFRGLQMRGQNGFGWTLFSLSDTDFCHFTANISKTVTRSVTCQLQLNISSTRAF